MCEAVFEPFYENCGLSLYLADAFEMLKSIVRDSVDMIFAAPPYFPSNGGMTCKNGLPHPKKHEFNRKWIRLCRPLLKPDGSIWITGTFHNIFSVGLALEQEGFRIINNITWQKTNPSPNLACRCFTQSTETLLWAQKNDRRSRHYFNYSLMKSLNGGRQMNDVWRDPASKPSEKAFGRHPTQKPIYLLERIILASTEEGDTVLDPFCVFSMTGVMCKRLGRKYIGIDVNAEFLTF